VKNNLEETLKELDRMAEEQQRKREEAKKTEEEAERLRQQAIEDGIKATVAEVKIDEARKATEEAKRVVDGIDDNSGEHNSDENTNKIESTKKLLTSVGAILLIGAVTIGSYVLIKQSISGKVKDDKASSKSISDSDYDNSSSNSYDKLNNVLVLDEDELLTEENFDYMISEYTSKYSNRYTSVNEDDITKFGAIANIDLLSEDNPEYAKELFGTTTKEEYLSDSAKVIGATVSYNMDIWNSTFSTKDFIKVSDIVFGESKEEMLKIEDYTDRIAHAVNENNRNLVNDIVSEFITDLNSGELSKLDDGIGFAAQVNIALIADGIARNYLNKENFDMFQILKTSEKYVSNIFTEYDRCINEDVKTLTRK